MEKKKYPRTDPNTQVHSEFETTIGNNFKTVFKETPTNNKGEDDLYDPLNQLPEDEYFVINEGDMEDGPAKMSAREEKVDKIPLLIGILGVFGLIGVISALKSLQVNKLIG